MFFLNLLNALSSPRSGIVRQIPRCVVLLTLIAWIVQVTPHKVFAAPSKSESSSIATECDYLAADPVDQLRVAPGVRMSELLLPEAMIACELAVEENPDSVLANYQLARVLEASGNYKRAQEHLEIGIVQGHLASVNRAGQFYYRGLLGKPDYKKAFPLLQRSAENGFASGMMYLGISYEYGRGTEKNPGAAFRWMSKAADLGLGYAQYYTGYMYSKGVGVHPDQDTAVVWFKKSIENKNAERNYLANALYNYGLTKIQIDYRKPREKSVRERYYLDAIQSLQRAHTLGHSEAAKVLSHLFWSLFNPGKKTVAYFGEPLINALRESGLEWLRSASDTKSSPEAMYVLGLVYKYGLAGQDVEKATARYYFEEASKMGHEPSSAELDK